MNYKIISVLSLLIAFLFSGCATQKYSALSKSKINNIENITISFHSDSKTMHIIDLGDIKGEIYSKTIGPGSLHGLLGVTLAAFISEGIANYKISKALGGNPQLIASNINSDEIHDIILSGIIESFQRETKNTSYINFKISQTLFNGLPYNNVAGLQNSESYIADHVIEIKYIYGIGVSEKYPAQPAIAAFISIKDPRDESFIQEREIYSDINSFYSPPLAIPPLNAYAENQANLFKLDLRKAAQDIGENLAMTYTIY